MAIDKNAVVKRIDELLTKSQTAHEEAPAEEVFSGTVSIIELLYGKSSFKIKSLFEEKKRTDQWDADLRIQHIVKILVGHLQSIKSEIDQNLISSIQQQISGEIIGDFISMSKRAIDDGYKDVAAVLASAAIEDALKKYAFMHQLNVDDKDMSEVVNALKSKSLLQGPQASLMSSYVQLRNKAFHAQWDKIDIPEVKSLITFTEEFILKNLS